MEREEGQGMERNQKDKRKIDFYNQVFGGKIDIDEKQADKKV